jgi:hypothetical protein
MFTPGKRRDDYSLKDSLNLHGRYSTSPVVDRLEKSVLASHHNLSKLKRPSDLVSSPNLGRDNIPINIPFPSPSHPPMSFKTGIGTGNHQSKQGHISAPNNPHFFSKIPIHKKTENNDQQILHK